MNRLKEELLEKLLKEGSKSGFSDMEVYIQGSNSLNIEVFQGELEEYSISDSEGISFRGIYNGKMGYSYSEKVDVSSIDMLVKEAKDNAIINESEDQDIIFEGSKEYRKVNRYNEELEKVDVSKKIDLTLNLEKEALKLDSRIETVNACVYGESSGYSLIVNSKGLRLHDRSNLAYCYVSVKAQEGDDIKTGSGYKISGNFDDFNAKEIAKKAVSEAVSMLGAKSIQSGEYEIVFKNNAMANLISAFSGIFSAEAVHKNLSLLKGKIDEQIGVSELNIIDNPFLENGTSSTGFDSEGVATKFKKIVENGKLNTFLHSLKTAKKDNVEPTGNGFKGYKSSISISPTNFYIEKGNYPIEDIMNSTEKGIQITELQGLHSGLNATSGDFSLLASGFLIEEGKITRPINQITIAGNFFDMIKDIDKIGDDLEFILPGSIGSPSIKVNKLNVSGE